MKKLLKFTKGRSTGQGGLRNPLLDENASMA